MKIPTDRELAETIVRLNKLMPNVSNWKLVLLATNYRDRVKTSPKRAREIARDRLEVALMYEAITSKQLDDAISILCESFEI